MTTAHPRRNGTGLSLSLMFAAIFSLYGVQLPYLPVWLNWKGLSAEEIGIVAAAPLFLRIFVTPAVGFTADQLGQRRGAIFVAIGCGLAALLASSGAHEFWSVLLLTVVFVVSFQTVLPLTETIALAAARDWSLDYGRVRLWGSFAFIAAGYVAGALLQVWGPGAILWLLVSGALAASVVTLFLPPQRLAPASREATAAGRAPPALAAVIRTIATPTFLLFLLAAGAVQASHAVFYAFGVLHWRNAGLSGGMIASLWSIGVVAEIALFAYAGRVLARLGAVELILLGGGAAVVRWSIMALDPPLPVLLPLQALHGLTFGATYLGAMRYLDEAVPRERAATTQSVYSALTAGVLTGMATLIAGAAYGAIAEWSYLIMALIACVGVGAALALRGRLAEEGSL